MKNLSVFLPFKHHVKTLFSLSFGYYRFTKLTICFILGLANSLASNFEDAITHFKNAANILETRIKTLENPAAATEDATVKKYTTADPFYSVEGEIKELKELLPEIQEKIQDMMDYKAEVRPCECLEETRKMLRDMILKEKNLNVKCEC